VTVCVIVSIVTVYPLVAIAAALLGVLQRKS
jgi:hypothetical protein